VTHTIAPTARDRDRLARVSVVDGRTAGPRGYPRSWGKDRDGLRPTPGVRSRFSYVSTGQPPVRSRESGFRLTRRASQPRGQISIFPVRPTGRLENRDLTPSTYAGGHEIGGRCRSSYVGTRRRDRIRPTARGECTCDALTAVEIEFRATEAQDGNRRRACELFRTAAATQIHTEPPSYPGPEFEGWAATALGLGEASGRTRLPRDAEARARQRPCVFRTRH
jgi:hypothetical protein